MTTTIRREDYLDAAMSVLATEGFGALKVGRLSQSLGVTTGSFYHHFDGLPDLVGALLQHWEDENTRRVAEAVAGITDPDDAIAVLKGTAVGLPHAAEANFRAWSRRDAVVAATVERVDAHREEVLTTAIGLVVGAGPRARDLAVVGLTVLIGFQQARDPADLGELGRLMDLFEHLIYAERALVAPA